MFSINNLKKTYYYLKRNGILAAAGAAWERVQAPYFADYTYVCPTEETLQAQRQRIWENPVLFSVVVPAYETPEAYVRVLIDSLRAQTYPYWELVIADAGRGTQVGTICEQYQEKRIRYVALQSNDGISENTNQALAYANGDYVGLLDHDDFLTPDALYEMANAIEDGKKRGREYGFLYSDEDKCDETGQRFYDPHFKMDFNLDLFLTNNYICHFCVMKRELIRSLGFRKAYDGAQDYDLCLRAVEELWKKHPLVEESICHVPKVLYHWRCHTGSTAANPQSKRYAYDAGLRALQDFLVRKGWRAEVEEMSHVGFYRIRYENGIFAQREDVAAVCTKEKRHGRVVSGIYDKDGKPLYQDLPYFYSGYLHRASLAQDVPEMDIQKWEIHPKLEKEIATFWETQPSNQYSTDAEKRKAICGYLKAKGYRLYWDPWYKKDRKGHKTEQDR